MLVGEKKENEKFYCQARYVMSFLKRCLPLEINVLQSDYIHFYAHLMLSFSNLLSLATYSMFVGVPLAFLTKLFFFSGVRFVFVDNSRILKLIRKAMLLRIIKDVGHLWQTPLWNDFLVCVHIFTPFSFVHVMTTCGKFALHVQLRGFA